MKRITVSLLLVALFAGVTASQAGLYGTPIDNHSFESVENGGVPGGWGYIIDDWYENEVPDSFAVFYENGPSIGLVGDGDLMIGFETGGAAYQDIGTVDDNQTYTLTALIGSRWGTSFVEGGFSLWAGGNVADAADGVALNTIAGATLLDSVSVTVADGTPVGTDVYSVSVDLSTGTGHTGETLWLQLESVSGKDYFDNVTIPEPATFGMVALFGGGLVLIRRKFRN